MIMITFGYEDLLVSWLYALCTVHCALCPWRGEGGFLAMDRAFFKMVLFGTLYPGCTLKVTQ